MNSLSDIESYLKTHDLKIEKQVTKKDKTLISYCIKNQFEEHGYLSIWVSERDEEKYINQLDTQQRRKFKQLKKI